jgi:hypothetical protein
MANILGDYRTYLLADSTLNTLTGGRVYNLEAPAEVTAPYIVFFTVSDPNAELYFGRIDAGEPIIQNSIYADTAAEVEAIRDALKTRVNSASFALTNFNEIRAKVVNHTWLREPDTQLFHCAVDVLIEYSEDI